MRIGCVHRVQKEARPQSLRGSGLHHEPRLRRLRRAPPTLPLTSPQPPTLRPRQATPHTRQPRIRQPVSPALQQDRAPRTQTLGVLARRPIRMPPIRIRSTRQRRPRHVHEVGRTPRPRRPLHLHRPSASRTARKPLATARAVARSTCRADAPDGTSTITRNRPPSTTTPDAGASRSPAASAAAITAAASNGRRSTTTRKAANSRANSGRFFQTAIVPGLTPAASLAARFVPPPASVSSALTLSRTGVPLISHSSPHQGTHHQASADTADHEDTRGYHAAEGPGHTGGRSSPATSSPQTTNSDARP